MTYVETMLCRAWMGKPQSPLQSNYASQQQKSRILSSSLLWPGYLPNLLSRVQTLVSPYETPTAFHKQRFVWSKVIAHPERAADPGAPLQDSPSAALCCGLVCCRM